MAEENTKKMIPSDEKNQVARKCNSIKKNIFWTPGPAANPPTFLARRIESEKRLHGVA